MGGVDPTKPIQPVTAKNPPHRRRWHPSILEKQPEFQQIFGPAGPTLAASGLHPWVWNAVASLWDDGHYGPAVHEATKAVELQTQLKVDRRNLDGKDLYARSLLHKGPHTGGASAAVPRH